MTTILLCDNQSPMYIVFNPTFHKLTKYIVINFYVVREKFLANLFHLLPISSNQELTYVFTKSFEPKDFNHIITWCP